MLFQKPLSGYSLICCIFLFLINQFSFGQSIQPSALLQIESLNAEKESRTMVQKKLDSQLWYALKMARGQAITPLVKMLDISLEKNTAGNVHIELSAKVSKSLLADLDKLGMQVEFSSERFRSISGFAPLLVVEKIATLDGVLAVKQLWKPMNNSWVPDAGINEKTESGRQDKVNTIGASIREALSPETAGINSITAGAVTSEADVTHKAALARNVFNVNGSGVKIGVISDSYNAKALAASDVTAGELPGVGNPNGYITPVTVLSDYATGTDEGRAMMQLVHDIAPGAQLYFATAYSTQAEFAQAILNLRAAGCDIIVDDISYFAEAVFQDGTVAQAVNAVTASGALYFSSAGNSGNKNDNTAGVWEGDFVDGGTNGLIVEGGSLHSFGANPYNIITLLGRSIWLKWSDSYGLSGNDYDLYTINAAGTTVLGASTGIQDGNDDAWEVLSNPAVNSRVVIFKKSSAATRALHLNTIRGRLSISTAGVVYGHNGGKNTISVAATPALASFPNFFGAANVVETFSSDGPRKIFYNPDSTAITPGNFLFASNGGTTLQKPDLTAADGTKTSVAGFIPFYGTSAAAPHAAAIAALVKSKLPSLSAAQIKAALNASAIDIETPGIDRDAGVGIIMAYEAIAAAGATPSSTVLSMGSAVLSEGSFGNGNGAAEPGESAGLVIPLTNLTSAGATAINSVLSTSTPGINIYRNSSTYSDLSGMATGTNASNPFLISIANSVSCGTSVSFTLAVTYSGGFTSSQTFSFTTKVGKLPYGAISGIIGNSPPNIVGVVSSSGAQTGRIIMNLPASSCAVPQPAPGLAVSTNSPLYHAYQFTNTSAASQCITVTISSPPNITHSSAAYTNSGFLPASPNTNFLADPGSSGTDMVYSFNVAANQNFTVVVHQFFVTTTKSSYTLDVGICQPAPVCQPVSLSPANLSGNCASVGIPFSQAFTAVGGSGAFQYSVTAGALPAGLSLSGNQLSGTPQTAGAKSFTITATDLICGSSVSNSYSLTVNPQPTIISFTPSSGAPGTLVTITGTNLNGLSAFTIGGVSAIVVSNTGATLVGMVMPGAATGPVVEVATPCGSATSAGTFTVQNTPFPIVQQGTKLTASDGLLTPSKGFSVALSADGTTALVGGYYDNNGAGATWVYTRSGNTWSQQAKLIGTGAAVNAWQGFSVALSANGNTAIVGGVIDNSAWVFTRSGSTWSQQGPKLVGSDRIGNAWFGKSVALSADGNTALVGGLWDNANIGAAWVFTRSGTTWTQQGTKLVGTLAVGAAQQATSVSLSADGNIAAIGGAVDNSNVGATWIFTRSGNTWVHKKLVVPGVSGAAKQGQSVALSADATTLIIGGINATSNVSNAWVYTRSGSTWTQQGTTIVGSDAIGTAANGANVSLSADGNTAMMGSVTDNNNKGAAWVFTRSGNTYTQKGSKLLATGTVGTTLYMGRSVALSADGTNMLVGADGDASGQGAAWSYAIGVTYDGNGNTGGTVPISQLATLGSSVTLATNTGTLVKTGYTFAGWNTLANGTGTSYASGASITFNASLPLYARWTLNNYTVTFNANGGTGTMSNQTIAYLASANLTTNAFTRTGYTFAGWATTSGGTVAYANSASYTMSAAANVTLYAQWTLNNYTVKFDSNGGTGTMSNQTIAYLASANLTTNAFTRTGYTFAGWATTGAGAVAYANGASYTMTAPTNVTLYAKWSLNNYTVTFNANGGTGTMSNQTIAYLASANLTTNAFTRTGYTFAGWATTSGGTVAYANNASYTMSAAANVTLYAKWNCITTVSTTNVSVCANTPSYTWNGIVRNAPGTYTYTTTNSIGCDSTATLVLTILNKPAINSEFSGSNGVCRSKTGLVFSIPASAGATSYTWTLPAGMTGSSTTNSITVATSSTFAGGSIQVTANNSCGSSPIAQLALTALTAIPAAPASITGQTTVCAGYSLDFTCAEVVGATYTWTVPANANIISGQGTRTILVGFNDAYTTGAVSVKSTTCFGTSTTARSLTVAKKAIPGTPGLITGTNGFCRPTSAITQIYSILAVANATDYTWTAPANASIVSQSGTSVTVEFGAAYTTGTLSVRASNCSGTSPARVLTIASKALPGTVGVITGITTGACSAERRTYSVVALTNTDSYQWTVPANASIYSGQGSNSVVVEFAAGFTTGSLSVKGVNCSGTSVTARSLALSNVTATPTVLTGPATAVCAGSTQTYSTTAVANATTYTWAVPSGAIINSGQGGTSISVTFPSPFTSGAVTVKSGTACYTSAAKSLTVYSVPVAPASITGTTLGVCGGSTQTYTCPVSTTGAISYNWTVPAGATINSGQGGNSISVTLPTIFASGNVSVTSSNSCGTSTIRTLAIRSTLAAPGVISGQSTNLCGGGRYTYTIAAVTGASSYNWTIPAACLMVENLGTSITLDVPATGFTSGTLSVSAQNACGAGALRSLTISALPSTPASVSGPTSVCPSATGLVFSTPVVSGVSIYTWIVPTGASITAGQNTSSITAKWGTVAGSVTVKAGNACGTNATAKALAVTLSVACREAVEVVAENISLYPNPASQMATLNFSAAKEGHYQIRVINTMGQSVYSTEGKATEGANNIELNLDKLSSGLYIVQLVQDGSRQQVNMIKK